MRRLIFKKKDGNSLRGWYVTDNDEAEFDMVLKTIMHEDELLWDIIPNATGDHNEGTANQIAPEYMIHPCGFPAGYNTAPQFVTYSLDQVSNVQYTTSGSWTSPVEAPANEPVKMDDEYSWKHTDKPLKKSKYKDPCCDIYSPEESDFFQGIRHMKESCCI